MMRRPWSAASRWHSAPVSPVRMMPGIFGAEELAYPQNGLRADLTFAQAVVRHDDIRAGKPSSRSCLIACSVEAATRTFIAEIFKDRLQAEKHYGVIVHQHGEPGSPRFRSLTTDLAAAPPAESGVGYHLRFSQRRLR